MKKFFLTGELSLACLLTLTFMFMQSCNEQKTATDFAVEKIDSLFNNRYAAIENNENRPGGAVYILKGDTVIFDKGYGIGITAEHSVICCTIPTYGNYVYTDGTDQIDYYFIYGGDSKNTLELYKKITG